MSLRITVKYIVQYHGNVVIIVGFGAVMNLDFLVMDLDFFIHVFFVNGRDVIGL